MRIGILYICTGRYKIFWKGFYQSAEKFLLQGYPCVREYYVFTDSPSIYGEKKNKHIHRIYQENLGWPDNTLMRYHMFLAIREQLEKETDYLYFFNANMIIRKPIGKEFLPTEDSNDLAGLIHPCFFNLEVNVFTYDRNEKSKAYIPYGEGLHYYAGGLNGGTTPAFLNMAEILKENIEEDRKNGVVALWHDESHINRYFLDHPPFLLTPAYCYPEGLNIPFPEIIRLLEKDYIIGGKFYLRGGERSWRHYLSYWKNRFIRYYKRSNDN